MKTTWYEKGLADGREKGCRAMLRDQLEDKFGTLPATVQQRLQELPAERVSRS